ncbi:MAG: GNAT family N-acetyltransferase [Oligoflexales bacterium]
MLDTTLRHPGTLASDEIELVLLEKVPANQALNRAPMYTFAIRSLTTRQDVGTISLLVGNQDYILKFAGHIGYIVNEASRGRNYATKALRLILPLAKRIGLNPIWVTCNPDNIPSKKTCEKAGGKLVELIDVPPEMDMFRRGDHQKLRFRFDL